ARVRLAEDVARGRARLRGAPLRSHPRLHPLRGRDRRPGDRDRGGALVHAVVPARGRARARPGDRRAASLSRGGPRRRARRRRGGAARHAERGGRGRAPRVHGREPLRRRARARRGRGQRRGRAGARRPAGGRLRAPDLLGRGRGARPRRPPRVADPARPARRARDLRRHGSRPLRRCARPRIGAGGGQVPAPDGSPSPVRLRLAADPVARVGSATLLIENPDARPIAGRVVVVLAGGLATDPESLPARVAASGRTTVPLVLENRAALPPGSYPAYALFEYTASGEHHAAVARADVEVVADAGGRRARPLLVGASALAATLALLAVAW